MNKGLMHELTLHMFIAHSDVHKGTHRPSLHIVQVASYKENLKKKKI